jgi:2,3-bisphosphoglycerate-independent phosphoglycerate mutase
LFKNFMTRQQIGPKPVALVILDGWGVAPNSPGNAIVRAKTPNFDAFTREYFTTTLQAAGDAVGLRWGEVGNSEVGHLNIGAGKVIFQPQPRIDKTIIDGSFFKCQELLSAMELAKKNNSRLHIVGLMSDTGVHSTIEHLYALLEMAKQVKVNKLYIHAILDGRDSPYNSGVRYISRLQTKMKEIGLGQTASISGRFWAMDRDNRWQRIEKAYQAMTGESKVTFTDPEKAVKDSYLKNIFDEQFEPAMAIGDDKKPIGNIQDGESIIFFNFRADRSRQLSRALIDEKFDKFKRSIKQLSLTTFTEYDSSLGASVAFPSPQVENTLAKVVADSGLKQIHLAETEKYAHITYFLNGGREEPYTGEVRELVPSPPVTSYEEKPEMSALEIREKMVHAIESGEYSFLAVNFANADMVGHTGNMKATTRAIEVLDLCLGNIAKAVLAQGGAMIITADHGNAEGLMDLNTGAIDKEHSALPVPFILVSNEYRRESVLPESPDLSQVTAGGLLSDVAPTILKLLNLSAPKEMTGRSLI